MQQLVWIAVGAVGMWLLGAVSARLSVAHVAPDWAVLVMTFLALRREPVGLCAMAVVLGYLQGRAAMAPVGLHEVAQVVCTLLVYLICGSVTGGGATFLAMMAAGAVMVQRAIVYLLVWWQRGSVGFSSWATALLLPDAWLTGLVAVAAYAPLMALDRRLTQDRREGLGWRH